MYRLSSAQRGILLHTSSSPEAADLYFYQIVARLPEGADVNAFEAAWRHVVRQHPTLRTTFVWKGLAEPVQVVLREVDLPVERRRFPESPPEAQDRIVRRLLVEDRRRGIAPDDRPLLRIMTVGFEGGAAWFIVSFHALMLDGWSKGLVLGQVAEAYEALRTGRDPRPLTPLGFDAYIAWLEDGDLSPSEAFWRARGSGQAPPGKLRDRSLTADAERTGFDDHRLELGEDSTRRLLEMCRRHRLTASTLIHGAWAVLLGHYARTEEICIGSVVSGRPTEVEGSQTIVGFLTNTVPVRIDVPRDMPASDWLARLQGLQNRLREHDHVPLAQIREWDGAEHSGHLFGSVVAFESWPDNDVLSRWEELRVEPLIRTLYPLTLCVVPEPGSYQLCLAWARRCFRRCVGEWILRDFRALLEAIVEEPGRRLGSIVEEHATAASRITPERDREKARSASAEPEMNVRERVTAICRDLLQVEHLGATADFFSAGGHSLFATQLAARILDEFGVRIPLGDLYGRPTAAGVAELVSGLQADGGEAPRGTLPSLRTNPGADERPFPLTETQQAYWAGRHEAFGASALASNVYVAIRREELDIGRFRKAWTTLVRRHGMLRAAITQDGKQRVLPYRQDAVRVPVLDGGHRVADGSGRELEALRESMMSGEDGDGARWPCDVRISRAADGASILHFCFDLVAVDAASTGLLFDELAALLEDPDKELPPLEIDFRNYVAGLEEMCQGDAYRASRDYWVARLDTLPEPPQLPRVPDAARSDVVRRTATLSAARWQRVRETARRTGVTPAVALVSAYADVMGRWSDSSHFTINMPLFNRLPMHPDVQRLVGDFTTVNVLEVDCDAEPDFAARALRVQDRLWSDLDHRYMNGVEVMRELARIRPGTDRHRLLAVFTSLLDLDYLGPMDRVGQPIDLAAQTAQVGIDNQVYERDGELVIAWDAMEALFPAGVIDAMFKAYVGWLERLADESRWDSADGHTLSVEQLRDWQRYNRTDGPLPGGLLHDEFNARATESPEAPAVLWDGGSMSYGELQMRSRRLGRVLRDRGALPDALVAIVMEKGPEQLVAALGVLESGAAFLPIEASYPQQRIHALLRHGQAQTVLTQARIDRRLEWPDGVNVIRVDDPDCCAEADASPLEPAQAPSDLAYVTYTSGSTGKPKGVMVEHRSALNTVLDINRRFGVGPEDRCLALSALSFDLAIYDVFGLLAAGGAVVLPTPTTAPDPRVWAELCREHRVTIWNSVPAFLQIMVEYDWPRGAEWASSLRLALLSGDWIPLDVPDRIRAFATAIEVISLGGATEASIWSILYPVGEVEPDWPSIPYGRPLTNQQFWVLDEAMRPRPIWVEGELYIGGAGVARGYWRDLEQTRARFVEDPDRGTRLYRTGDCGRLLPDGNIELRGRIDFQTKIRGHRIETGEVEAALEGHPAIHHAMVMAVGDDPASRRLVAFVTCGQNQEGVPAGSRGRPLTTADPGYPGLAPADKGLRDVGEEPAVALPRPADEDIRSLYLSRQSFRRFEDDEISRDRLGDFLSCMMRLDGPASIPKYRYPSAGGLYPVQLYLHVKSGRIAELEAGTYYYQPVRHALVPLRRDVGIDTHTVHTPNNHDLVEASALSLFLVADMAAIEPVYGQSALDFCMLEAGYIGQLLMDSGAQSLIGLCPIGDVAFEHTRSAFAIGDQHIFLHCLVGGAIRAEQLLEYACLQAPRVAAEHRDESVSATNSSPTDEELRGYLGERLPDYMVPSSFHTLDSWPLTPVGKVDRRALLQLAEERKGGVDAERLADDGLEQTIVDLWSEVLGVDRIGRDSNFFDLGGNSLSIMVVHAKLQEILERDLDVVDLFRYPTVHVLADRLSDDDGTPDSSGRGALRRRMRRRRRSGRSGHGSSS